MQHADAEGDIDDAFRAHRLGIASQRPRGAATDAL